MKAMQSATKSIARGKLSLTIVEASIAAHALPSVISNGAFQSYVSLVCNKQMFKTACAQGNLGAQNPVWMHSIQDIEVVNPERDSVFISVFASQLGGNQFKNIGTAQVRLDLFTCQANLKSDGWFDLPQQMGRVKLITEFKLAQESEYMDGAKVPHSSSLYAQQANEEPGDEWESEMNCEDAVEETKETSSRRREENSKWSHLPSLEQLLDQNGYRAGQQTLLDAEMIDEEAVEPNQEFVRAFDHFGSFAKAAGYIEDWIRSKKNNATDFTNDFPAVLERGCSVRRVILKMRKGEQTCELNQDGHPVNPEVRNVHQLILTKQLCETEQLYILVFTLNLLEACCQKPEVPLLVVRIAINHIGILVADGKLKITEEMQRLAMEKLGGLRAEVIFDFVKHMGLGGVVKEDYFLQLAKRNLEVGKYAEAAVLVIKFRFFDHFDLMQLIYELVESKRVPTAKLLIENQPHLKEKVVRMLSTNLHAKTAADLVKDYKLNPEDFPELQAIISRNSSSYFIGRAFRAPSHADYMPLHKIEDLFTNNTRMLLELVQSLLRRGMNNQAVGVYLRHSLEEQCPEALRQEVMAALQKYDPAEDQVPTDQFGPTSGNQCLRLPPALRVHFVGQEKDCELLRTLVGREFVGMDSEWRPQMTKFDMMRPALLQLSDEHNAFLIDLVSLANSQVLDQVLTELFTHESTICIGFSFKSDMDVFAKHLPRMNFYKYMRNFIDAQTYYSKVFVAAQQTGLAKVAKEVLRFEICKGEQMSNWEKRPMRLSQQHYAALDAYCLIPIIGELTKRAQVSGQFNLSLKANVHSLRWTGGNDKNSLGGGGNGGNGQQSQASLDKAERDRKKRTKKRADQRRNNKNNLNNNNNQQQSQHQHCPGTQHMGYQSQNQYHYQSNLNGNSSSYSAGQQSHQQQPQQQRPQMYMPSSSGRMSNYYK